MVTKRTDTFIFLYRGNSITRCCYHGKAVLLVATYLMSAEAPGDKTDNAEVNMEKMLS